MDKHGQIFRALVVDADSVTGNISVTIPALGGTLHAIPITGIGRTPIDGVWKVPESGSVVLVGTDDANASTLFLIPTYSYDEDLWATDVHSDFHGPVVFVARNDSGASIPANTVVCGQADGSELVIIKANGNDTAKPAIGITVDAISANGYGKVAVGGVLSPIDTSSFAANIDLFAGTTGNLVSTPVGLANPQIVCRVLEVGAAGSVLLTVENPATEELGSFSGTFLGTVYATAGNLGGSASGWIIDSNRIESRGSTQKIVLDGTDGEIYIGTYGVGVYNSASTPFYVNEDGYFSLGNKLTFDPTTSTLDVNGTVTADDGQIGGWTIEANKLSAGTGASTVALASSGGTAIWAGASAPAGATFKVTDSGYLTASGVDLSGRLVATSGSIGNWVIDGGTLKSTTGSAGTPIVLDSTNGKVYVGNENWANTNNRFYVDNLGKFSLGSKLTWDTTNLIVDGTITAASGTIGGWSIDNTKLYAGTGSNYIALSSDNSVEYRTWAGHPTPASAPYYITKAGGLYASNASIQGNIIATSGSFTGSITGASVSGSSITGGSISGGYITGGSISGGYITGGSVSGGYITGGSVSGGYITGGSISGTSVSGSTVTGGSISGGYITGGSVSGGYITGGSINGSSITIGSNFSVNTAGSLTAANASISGNIVATSGSFTGSLTSTSGSIGGFSIGTNTLTAGTGSSAVGISSDSTYPFWAGKTDRYTAPFSVRYDGYVTASSVSVLNFYNTGSSPAIIQGRFTVDGDKVQLGRQIGTGASNTGIYINKTVGTTNDATWDNYIYADGRVRIGSSTGYLTFDGSNLTVSGTVYATGGSFTGSISAASVSGSTVTGGSISGGYITGGSVSGGYITGGSISGTSVTGASLSGGQITIGSNFSVNSTGTLTASGASIAGTINAASINAQAGNVGGFTLGATSLTAGSGASAVGLNTTGYPFYAGNTTPTSAPFYVTSAGSLVSTAGSIGGWTIGTATVQTTSGGSSGPYAALYSGSTIFAGSGPIRIQVGTGASSFKVDEAGAVYAAGFNLMEPSSGTSVIATLGKSTTSSAVFLSKPSGTTTTYQTSDKATTYSFDWYKLTTTFPTSSAGSAGLWWATRDGVFSSDPGVSYPSIQLRGPRYSSTPVDAGPYVQLEVASNSASSTAIGIVSNKTYVAGSALFLEGGGDVTGSNDASGRLVLVGSTTSMGIDENEIQVRTTGGSPVGSTLVLNKEGGDITLGSQTYPSATINLRTAVSALSTIDASDTITAPRTRLTATTNVALASTGHALQIGSTSGANMIFDNNEIMARNNGAAALLQVNNNSGHSVSLGAIANNIADTTGRYFLRTNTAHTSPHSIQRGTTTGTTDASADLTVTFDEAFTGTPTVVASPQATNDATVTVHTVSTTGFKVRVRYAGVSQVAISFTFHWIAIGPNTALP